MKRLFFLFLLILPLRSFATEIRDLYVDEEKQQLIILGHFDARPGVVTVDSVLLPILSWTDSEIVCLIDSDGRGSCGPVVVNEVAKGTYDSQLLTLIQLKLEYARSTGMSAYLSYSSHCTWDIRLRFSRRSRHSVYAMRSSSGSFTCDGHGSAQLEFPYTYYSESGAGSILWEPSLTEVHGLSLSAYPRSDTLVLQMAAFTTPDSPVTKLLYKDINLPPTDSTHEQFEFASDIRYMVMLLDSASRVIGGGAYVGNPRSYESFGWTHVRTLFAPPVPAGVTLRSSARVECLPGKQGIAVLADGEYARADVRVMDLLGRVVASERMRSADLWIPLKSWEYFVQLSSETGCETLPVIVQ